MFQQQSWGAGQCFISDQACFAAGCLVFSQWIWKLNESLNDTWEFHLVLHGPQLRLMVLLQGNLEGTGDISAVLCCLPVASFADVQLWVRS